MHEITRVIFCVAAAALLPGCSDTEPAAANPAAATGAKLVPQQAWSVHDAVALLTIGLEDGMDNGTVSFRKEADTPLTFRASEHNTDPAKDTILTLTGEGCRYEVRYYRIKDRDGDPFTTITYDLSKTDLPGKIDANGAYRLDLYPGFMCGANAGDAVECIPRKGTVQHAVEKASAERLFEQASRISETACKTK